MSEIKINPYSNLPPEETLDCRGSANWMVHFPDGTSRGDWTKIEDQGYRVSIEHALVTIGNNTFDKINVLGWGAFVLPMRVSSRGVAEFCLNRERRIMLRDDQGVQGGVFTHNIPQGAIKPGESTITASIREAREETGTDLVDILLLGKLGFDIANSESLQDIFLGLVPYSAINLGAQLDETEDIEWKWYTWQEIGYINLIDSKTESALYKASRAIHPQLLVPEIAGRFNLVAAQELSPRESFEWYIKPDVYPKLRQQTLPNYPHNSFGL